MGNRVYNFNAGPSAMPLPVLEEIQQEFLDFNHTGMSIVEISHRSDAYQKMQDETIALLRKLLNIPDENLMQLVDYVQRMDEEAKPADWTPDLLLWFLLNSRLKANEKRTHAQKLAFPRLYKGLYKVIQAADSEAALKALKDYIGKWYNLNKDASWYDSHLRKNCYSGYWAWEVAAVAKIMHIDDTDLKDNPYYPYDMVHWEEDREE